ncbi:hypothetical protein FS749_014358 [Ceratobasidium sp. UAMH 11750]|nr:hypothetical protein FS749_014358 [Ceratobasidium sp. UAMH 11750]
MDSDDEYQEATRGPKRKVKRQKREIRAPSPAQPEDPDTLLLERASLFAQSAHNFDLPKVAADSPGFEATFSPVAEEYLQARHRVESAHATRNDHGHMVRLISRLEADQLVWELTQKQGLQTSTRAENILLRRLTQKLPPRISPVPASNQAHVAEPLPLVAETQPAPPGVLEELCAIKSTPYDQSFASRVYGYSQSPTTIFFQDWETMSPWMELMADVMAHHRISRPLECNDSAYIWAPITYTPIYAFHLSQVHDLLERTFWPGIDVSDSVNWEPEQCSIVASYKKLVVGCAFLSETMDPYVTYIAVRAGWERAGIASFMLYHLIKQNPNQDISLHVSATNLAILLYNRFGFKAEEFVVGFYDDYLDEQTKLCKNALRLRYRR